MMGVVTSADVNVAKPFGGVGSSVSCFNGVGKGKERDSVRSLIVTVSKLGEKSFEHGPIGLSSSIEPALNRGNGTTGAVRNRVPHPPPIPPKSKLRKVAQKALLYTPNPSSTNLSNISQRTSREGPFYLDYLKDQLENPLSDAKPEVHRDAGGPTTPSQRLSIVKDASPEGTPDKNQRPYSRGGIHSSHSIKRGSTSEPFPESNSQSNAEGSAPVNDYTSNAYKIEFRKPAELVRKRVANHNQSHTPGNLSTKPHSRIALANIQSIREKLGISDFNLERVVASLKNFGSKKVVPALGKILKAVDFACKNTTTLGFSAFARGYGFINAKTFHYFEGLAKTCPHAAIVGGIALIAGSFTAAGLTGGIGLVTFPFTMPVAAGLLHGGAKEASRSYSSFSSNMSRKMENYLKNITQPQEFASG